MVDKHLHLPDLQEAQPAASEFNTNPAALRLFGFVRATLTCQSLVH